MPKPKIAAIVGSTPWFTSARTRKPQPHLDKKRGTYKLIVYLPTGERKFVRSNLRALDQALAAQAELQGMVDAKEAAADGSEVTVAVYSRKWLAERTNVDKEHDEPALFTLGR